MKIHEILESKKYDIAAQLDSNGKEVKIPKINMGSSKPATEIDETATYNKVRNTYDTKAKYKITKTSKSNVWLDMVDENGQPIEGKSGNRGYQVSISAFGKDYKKIKE